MAKVNSKQCSKCGNIKSLDEFYFHKGKNKYIAECKECFKEGAKLTRLKYKNSNTKTTGKKTCSLCKETKNIDEFYTNSYMKYGVTSECKSCIKKQRKEYSKRNKEKISARRKRYYKENKEKIIEKNVQYEFNRRQKDFNYRLKRNIHSLFRKFVKNKSKGFEEYVDYTYDDLIEYLGYDGLNTDKYHVDHIIPKNLYDFKDENEIKKCWSLKNLRLISSEDNLKRNKDIDWDLVDEYDLYDILPKGIKYEQ